jgi:hypothetical protein|tara:strand:+ start:694 stop:1962 length:1269 start_codon:yes stop_codon:yes gene_type:complete
MAKQTISIGSAPNDGQGSTIRAGGDLINDNFNEIYTAFGDGTNLSSGFIVGKLGGTNFSNSIIVGHSTTGTLSNATQNTSIGLAAMDAITSGNRNTVVGYQAATSLQDGEDNIAIGKDSMQSAVSPSGNVAIGTKALNANISSVDNTAVGHEAGKLVTGRNNTFLGAEAGDNVTTGSGNVLIGSTQADSATGDRQLEIAGNDGTTHTVWLKGASTGEVTVTMDPVSNLGVATKQYVDGTAAGLNVHESVAVATTQNLATETGGTVTYNNGTSGVGATLTLSSAMSTLDGYSLVNADRVLVKDEANQAHNGIYVRTSSTVLTRATDYDQASDVQAGDFAFITNGTVNDNSSYVQTTPMVTMGTTNMTWSQYAKAGTGTMSTQNANAVNITGGSISLSAVSNTQSLLVKNSSGATLKTIYGTSS